MTSSRWPGKGGEQAMDDYGLTVEIHDEPGHVLITRPHRD